MQLCGHLSPSVAPSPQPVWKSNGPRVFTASAAPRLAAAAASETAPVKDKKAPSAYNLFVKERYPAVKAKDPSTTLGSMSGLWKQASAADKSGFEQQAAKAKAAYEQAHPKVPKAPKAKVTAAPVTAYNLFLKEEFPRLKQRQPDAQIGDVAKLWKTADKTIFTERAAVARAAWEKEHPKPEKPAKPAKEPRVKQEKAPSAKPPSAYNRYVKANATDESRVESEESVFTRLGRRWKAMPASEKAKWASA